MEEIRYHYQEVKCPMCEHTFVFRVDGSTYRLRGSDKTFHMTSCTKCGCDLFVAPEYRYGTVVDFVPEEDVKIVRFVI